jgi:hypothetical protein
VCSITNRAVKIKVVEVSSMPERGNNVANMQCYVQSRHVKVKNMVAEKE